MRIQVSGGYTGEVSVELTDKGDLAGATFKMALFPFPLGTDFPPIGDSRWKSVTGVPGVDDTGGVFMGLTLPVNSTVGLGKFKAWALFLQGGLSIPVCAGNETIELV